MIEAGRGVILTLSTPGSHMSGTGFLGYGVTCAAGEAFTRLLAADLGPAGIRVNCIRPHAIPQALAKGSHAGDVFRPIAERAGITVEAMLAQAAAAGTLLKRFPTLDEVAETAAFLASDHAGAMTAAIANLSCGALLD
ncbi:MAG TPA: SDR family oxidoreductase [Myxococcales bacterium]|nr:SDR family oxidoreductase [Myxococcales bacterium]